MPGPRACQSGFPGRPVEATDGLVTSSTPLDTRSGSVDGNGVRSKGNGKSGGSGRDGGSGGGVGGGLGGKIIAVATTDISEGTSPIRPRLMKPV